VDRNYLADLKAVAIVPGLEAFADAFDRHVPATRKVRRDPLGLAYFMVAKGVLGSENQLNSLLSEDGTWEIVRRSASLFGRELPENPPTTGQFTKVIRAGGAPLALDLATVLTPVGIDISRQAELLVPRPAGSLWLPARGNTLCADGTVTEAMTDVGVADGVIVGSRAADPAKARIAPRYGGKDAKKPTADELRHGGELEPPALRLATAAEARARRSASKGKGAGGRRLKSGTGLPYVGVSVHGGTRWLRTVVGLTMYLDRNEIAAAVSLLERVLSAAGRGAESVAYDRALRGAHFEQLMRNHGVVPVVDLEEPGRSWSLKVPEDQRVWRGNRAKAKVRVFRLGQVAHTDGSHTCHHQLWAIDGALRVSAPDAFEPSLDFTLVPQTRLRAVRGSNGYQMLATYRIPCALGAVDHTIDLTSPPPEGTTSWANILRPIPESDPRSRLVRGRRSDIESVWTTIQDKLPKQGRATRLDPHMFLIDMVGHAMAINATCFDVHVAQHTTAGRHQHERLSRGVKY
jgi:hypothetical protein